MRYVAMQLLTWGTIAGSVACALWLASLDERPPALSTAWTTSATSSATAMRSQVVQPQRLPGPLADAASAPAGRQ